MKFPVSPHISKVHPPPISEVRSWLAAGKPALPVIDLCQAVPDYPPPPELREHLARLVSDPLTSRYTPDEGLPEVRETVCAWYRTFYGARINPDQLCLTVGASQAFWLAMITLCRAGDEVVVQLPAYFDHPMALEMLGIRPVYAPFNEENGGLPDPAVIAGLITPKTRALLLVSPSNPTGAVVTPNTVRQLHELATSRGIALVLDETYNSFITGGERPHDLFCATDWSDHFIHIASFGKTFALTGYRAGMLAASEAFIGHALKAQDTMTVCQPRLTQQAVKFGMEHLGDWVAGNRIMMERRHEVFREEFARPGNPFQVVASGPFFGWVRHPFEGSTGREVAKLLALQYGLMLLPGEVFGPGLERYLRLAFGNIHEEQIPEAVERFRMVTVSRPPAGTGS